jgi:serine/threonine protein kinase
MTVKCPKCQAENPETKQFCADCGTQLSSSRDIHPGVTETLQTPVKELTTGSTFAGRYQIIEELGKGGMGKVYKVFDTDIKERVALKLLKPEVASDKETIERAREEYQKMISLTTGRLSYGDLFAKSFYGLGKIYQQKKWTAKTIEQYREFLTLWKDSDPGIPELIDAKNRFAELLDK